MTNVIDIKGLCAATAAYFSSQGYFIRRNFETPGLTRVDIICIMPRLSDLKKRIKSKYFIPSGILYTLLNHGWKTTEDIALETNSDNPFVNSILDEICEEGWVEKKIEDKKDHWRFKDYRIPSKDCIIVHCRYLECMEILKNLRDFEGCYNKMYFVFPYPIDEKFMDLCFEEGIGILIFYENVGFFKEILPSDIKKITNFKVYANLCEVIIKENLLYRSIDSI